MNSSLVEYVLAHTQRGTCQCGKCIDAPAHPIEPIGSHTVDLVMFKVHAQGADAETLRKLVKEHKGEFAQIDMFDGKEHSYIEVGGFIGDQGLALMLMGLGATLGLWKLLTPYTILGKGIPQDFAMQMAGAGYVTVTSG